jgi:hypothetical protein
MSQNSQQCTRMIRMRQRRGRLLTSHPPAAQGVGGLAKSGVYSGTIGDGLWTMPSR